MKHLALLLAVMSAVLCGRVRAAERHALIVGVNECPRFRLAGGTLARPLRGAERDADAVAHALEKQFGFPVKNIELLKGPRATYSAVKSALERLRKKARRGDLVVFHFSGHGTQIPDRAPFDETEDGLDEALCLADATHQGDNLLVDDELGRWLDDIEAERVTVILDCCHAGTGTKDPDDEIAARYLPFPGVERSAAAKSPWRELKATSKNLFCRHAAFFACQPEQQAYERRFAGMQVPARVGQFTHYLLLGLSSGQADSNGDGVITNAEAVEFARSQLNKSFNQARDSDARQLPMLESDDEQAPFIGTPAATADRR